MIAALRRPTAVLALVASLVGVGLTAKCDNGYQPKGDFPIWDGKIKKGG